MKTLGVLFFILVAGIGSATAQQNKAPQKPKVRPDVSKRVQEKGVAKVGIVLNGDWHLDSIATAQKSLMAELAGSKHEVIFNSTIGPYTSLEIGAESLGVLESSSLLHDVYVA